MPLSRLMLFFLFTGFHTDREEQEDHKLLYLHGVMKNCTTEYMDSQAFCQANNLHKWTEVPFDSHLSLSSSGGSSGRLRPRDRLMRPRSSDP